jgi:uncharacterized phage infection (PIP) family protein YhgE
MRRTIFYALGGLEVLVAGVLVYFVCILPTTTEVQVAVGRMDSVTRQASGQIAGLSSKMDMVARRQPELRSLADQMRDQTRALTDLMEKHVVDYKSMQTVGEALGQVAEGMDSFADILKPDMVQSIGAGLLATADFLDKKVAVQAEQSAAQLEKSVALMKGDAEKLRALSKEVTLDFQAARDVYEAMGRFNQGLDLLRDTLKGDSLEAIREGFKGLDGALNQGADQIERISSYTYPVVKFNGLQPMVEQKSFWPDGGKIADDMRKAAKGTTAAGKELEALAEKELPKIRAALEDSRKVAEKTHEALGQSLKNRDKLEPLIKSVPENAARLAEELPRLGNDLAKVLRDTGHLKEVAALLRQAEQGLGQTAKRWPDLQKNLARSATLLRETQKQLQAALGQRKDYDAGLKSTVVLVRSFSAAAPLFTDQLEVDLRDQERSLNNLRTSIDEVTHVLPEYGAGAARLLTTTRLLLSLVAGIFALHGIYLVGSTRADQAAAAIPKA